MPLNTLRFLFAACLTALLAACGGKPDSAPKAKGPSATQITVTQSKQVDFEVVETTVGTVESTIDPRITAEVAGRIRQVLGRAGAAVPKGQLLAVIDPAGLPVHAGTPAHTPRTP